MRLFIATTALLMAIMMIVGCGASKKVTRINPNEMTDLSGKWNDTDSRLVAEEMIRDCLSRPWITDFAVSKGKKPVVTVGRIGNNTDEHINTETFSKDFERELLNSGKVRFVAGKEQRSDIRAERQEQKEFASRETVKKLREETGADFVLVGAVKAIKDSEGGKQVTFYQTDLELINVESMEKVWIGSKKIKKFIE